MSYTSHILDWREKENVLYHRLPVADRRRCALGLSPGKERGTPPIAAPFQDPSAQAQAPPDPAVFLFLHPTRATTGAL
eukprot:scaffold9484_cov124-Isochrysis_galbana.AAC.23